MLLTVLHSHVLHQLLEGVASGALAAAHVDYAAFTQWKSWQDAENYNWSIATWRWTKGAIIGGVSSGVLGSFLS